VCALARENEYPGRAASASRTQIRVEVESKTSILATASGIEGDMVDISLGGLGFVSKVQIPPEAGITLSFALHDKSGNPFVFDIKGNLIHSTYVKRRDGYLNGFEFDQLSQEQMGVLRAYIDRVIKGHLRSLWG
jgi:c-di-GMP-binding flagellar brake protein YcgR